MADLIVPAVIIFVLIYALSARCDAFSAFADGARAGLKTVLSIFPPVLAMLTAVNMLQASGAVDWFTHLVEPVTGFLGIPSACAPLMLLKPVSGGGALAVGADIMERCGVDSAAGRTAAVMLASADTTFFVISVYFSSLKIKRSGAALPGALAADAAAFMGAAWAVRLLMK